MFINAQSKVLACTITQSTPYSRGVCTWARWLLKHQFIRISTIKPTVNVVNLGWTQTWDQTCFPILITDHKLYYS